MKKLYERSRSRSGRRCGLRRRRCGVSGGFWSRRSGPLLLRRRDGSPFFRPPFRMVAPFTGRYRPGIAAEAAVQPVSGPRHLPPGRAAVIGGIGDEEGADGSYETEEGEGHAENDLFHGSHVLSSGSESSGGSVSSGSAGAKRLRISLPAKMRASPAKSPAPDIKRSVAAESAGKKAPEKR